MVVSHGGLRSYGLWMQKPPKTYETGSLYIVAAKRSWNLLVKLTEIATVNKGMYVNILCCYRVAVRRKRPAKWSNSKRVLLHYNAPAHRWVFDNDFLTQNDVTTMGHPLSSPDLAPSDFYIPSTEISTVGMALLWCYECNRSTKEASIKWLPGMFPTSPQSLAAVCSCTK
jgi:hypothetical protein